MHYCPKCDKPMDHIEAEPDVDILGGWDCVECEQFIHDMDCDDDEP